MCDCLKTMNELLRDHNTMLCCTLSNPAKTMVETMQIETGRGKQKAVSMVASFCPFCGDPYHAAQILEAAEQ